MKKQDSSSFGGTRGIAKVGFNPDGSKCKVTFVKKLENGEEEEGKKFVVSQFPVYLKSGRWYVRMSSDEDEILSASPSKGMFTVKVAEFPAPKGEEPTPKTKESVYDGKAYVYQHFNVLLDILKPDEFKGATLLLNLRYHFDEDVAEVNGKEQPIVAISHPQSKYTNMLLEFLEATGVTEKGPMPFKANILPLLQKRVLNANKTFQVLVKDGWITSIFSEYDDEEDDAKETESSFAPDIEDAPF